jgi:ClpP class serine protease
MIRNPALLSRLFGTPLLILPSKADAIIAGLLPRFGLPGWDHDVIGAYPNHPDLLVSSRAEFRAPGYRVDDGIAIIDIGGVLAHRGGIQADSSYILGYEAIAKRRDAAMSDPEVKAVASIFYSPGGEAAGAFQAAQGFADQRGKKPMIAIVDELATSAAYAMAAGHDEIVITPGGYAGSVGVYMRHLNIAAALAKEGVEVTQIFSGAQKADGHPFGPLTKDVRDKLQASVDAMRYDFASLMAQYRGLKTEDVLATEAGIYRGQEAVDIGFADRVVASADLAIAELRRKVSPVRAASAHSSTLRGPSMSKDNPDAVYTQSDINNARAEGHAAGLTEGQRAGAETEKARILGILNHAEAAARMPQAVALAEAGLTIEAAGKVLATMPAAQQAQAGKPSEFERHMAALGNPAAGPTDDQAPDPSQAAASVWDNAYKAIN